MKIASQDFMMYPFFAVFHETNLSCKFSLKGVKVGLVLKVS